VNTVNHNQNQKDFFIFMALIAPFPTQRTILYFEVKKYYDYKVLLFNSLHIFLLTCD